MTEETKKQFQESLQRMYELGVEHGRELEKRDITIKNLEDEIGELQGQRLIEQMSKKEL